MTGPERGSTLSVRDVVTALGVALDCIALAATSREAEERNRLLRQAHDHASLAYRLGRILEDPPRLAGGTPTAPGKNAPEDAAPTCSDAVVVVGGPARGDSIAAPAGFRVWVLRLIANGQREVLVLPHDQTLETTDAWTTEGYYDRVGDALIWHDTTRQTAGPSC